MFRVVLAIVFAIISVSLIAASTLPGLEAATRDILGNLGTEVFGILVTIALVDWFLEKRRRQDRARELAWGVLHEVEHAVWVWQGGPRQLGTSEILGIISGIRRENTMAPFTEGLMMNVGVQCRSILQRELSTLKSLPGLPLILRDMVSLANIRDLPESTQIRTLSEILEASVTSLARVLSQPTDRMPSGLIWHKDPTAEGQENRYRQSRAGAPGTFLHDPGQVDQLRWRPAPPAPETGS